MILNNIPSGTEFEEDESYEDYATYFTDHPYEGKKNY
jgi:hypothetical protein